MALPAFVESEEAVPQGQAEHYRAADDGNGFVLDVQAQNGLSLGPVEQLHQQNLAAAQSLEELQGVLPDGTTADQLKTALERLAHLEQTGGDVNAQAQFEITQLKEQIGQKDQSISSMRVNDVLKDAVVAAGGTALAAKALGDFVRAGDKGEVVVLDDNLQPARKLVGTNLVPEDVNDLVARGKQHSEIGLLFKSGDNKPAQQQDTQQVPEQTFRLVNGQYVPVQATQSGSSAVSGAHEKIANGLKNGGAGMVTGQMRV